jgi:hypothetical protein
MRDPLPGGDSKSIWRNQPTENSTMTSKLIQQKARDLQAKTRRQLMGTLAGPVATGFLYAIGIKQFPALPGTLHPLFLIAVVWSLVGLYFVTRGMWPGAMPADAGLSTGLEFCRCEIGRRRAVLQRLLLWSFGPIVFAIGTFIVGLVWVGSKTRGIFPNGLPFLVLVVVWIVSYFVIRMREQRELQRELEELDDLR